MVATVTRLSEAASTVHYFEADGYYAKNDPEHRKASRWPSARAVEALGLHGPVKPRRLRGSPLRISASPARLHARLSGRLREMASTISPPHGCRSTSPSRPRSRSLVLEASLNVQRAVRAKGHPATSCEPRSSAPNNFDEAVIGIKSTLDFIEQEIVTLDIIP